MIAVLPDDGPIRAENEIMDYDQDIYVSTVVKARSEAVDPQIGILHELRIRPFLLGDAVVRFDVSVDWAWSDRDPESCKDVGGGRC